jgi:hypothetical protein
MKKYIDHIQAVMQTFKKAGLYVKIHKYEFYQEEKKYWGPIVGW